MLSACGATADLLRLQAIKLSIEFLPYREHSVHCKDQPVNAAKGNNGSLLWESQGTHAQCGTTQFFFLNCSNVLYITTSTVLLRDDARCPMFLLSNNILCCLLPKQVVLGRF